MPKCEQCGEWFRAKDACYKEISDYKTKTKRIIKICPKCKRG